MRSIIYLSIVSLLFVGCTTKTATPEVAKETQQTTQPKKIVTEDEKVHTNLNKAIISIADQLLVSNVSQVTDVILTSFVDLNQLNKTTTFGRLLGESMYNELHIRKFNVTDFRGQDAISVNADGEFHITRDVTKLKDHIGNIEYIVVGTYVKFEAGTVLINARIIDSESGKIISTARVIYKPDDCALFDICKETRSGSTNGNIGDGIDIVTDNCSRVSCPTGNCRSNSCSNY